MLRKGAEDYEYLWLLSDLLKGLPDEVRTGAAAQEAAAFLEHAAEGVAGGASEIETTGGAAQPNAQRQSAPHALRERAAAWIERLTPPGR